MRALRLLFRQTHQRPFPLSCCAVRKQHDSHGPHKEYFQNPNQQYKLADHHPAYLEQYQQLQHEAPQSSRLARFFRSTFYASTFFALGWVGGTALITWEYLQPPYEKGSEEDLDLYDDIAETVNTCSLVESLREAEWKEEDIFIRPMGTGAQQSQHLLHQTLDSVQGAAIKLFRHPSEHYTILVFYPGFGCEGWPDVVHGGLITSMMIEAMEKHLEGYPELRSLLDRKISVDFKVPVRPGDIYSVLVPPSSIDVYADPARGGQESEILLMKMTSFLMHMEVAPRVSSQFDSKTNTENHIIEIPSTFGHDATHAIAQGDVFLIPKEWYDQIVGQGGPDQGKIEELKSRATAKNSQKDVFAQIGAAMNNNLPLSNADDGDKAKDRKDNDTG